MSDSDESIEFRDDISYDDEGISTITSESQIKVEQQIAELYQSFDETVNLAGPLLLKREHVAFCMNGIRSISTGYQALDASRPWICYWILHALDLLGGITGTKGQDIAERAASFLGRCQSPTGGFGGGPGQLPHLAPTYASINALMICGAELAYKVVDRENVYKFLLSMKDPVTGAFHMHHNGEVDVRGSYCALSVASLLNILTPELAQGAGEFIARCQTYEGGMGGYPGNEAHGGYTFCALAALVLLGKTDLINFPKLVEWAVHRQMKFEGGFQGRTNKLVDSCYSFWQGGIYPLIDLIDQLRKGKIATNTSSQTSGSWMFNQLELQKYLLLCCQDSAGGLKDKPGKNKDYYHTCYALSGLSIAQHNADGSICILGNESNLLRATHPVYNINTEKAAKALAFFRALP